MSDLLDEVEGGWDDPELDPPMPDLRWSGPEWVWVPEWKNQSVFGASKRLWGQKRPPVTSRLAESLHPYERAHFAGEVSWDYLRYRADRVMHRRDAYGSTAEDVVNEVLIDMERVSEREGYVPGDREWMKTAEVVIRRRVTDLLRVQGGQKGRGNRYDERNAKFFGEYVAMRGTKWYEHSDPEDEASDHDPLSNVATHEEVSESFSDEFREQLGVVLTPRELEAVMWTYEHDLSSDQAAEKMDCSSSTVRTLVERGLNKVRNSL